MRTKPNYFIIGLFVSVGLILITGALIILGAGSIWREHAYIETYIDGSVQGVDVGSAVKMRGVQVGNIQHISFVLMNYPEAVEAQQRYVMLEITLSLKTFGDITPDQLTTFLQEEVEKGLRIRMQPMGITGSAYIEMDYTDPLRNPPLPISWTPETAYIPSAPGTFARLEETFESLGATMTKIEEMDLNQTLRKLNGLISSLTDTVDSLDMKDISTQAGLFLDEIRQTNRKLSMIMGPESIIQEGDVSLYSILTDAGAVVRNVRKGLDRLRLDEDQGLMDQLTEIIEGLRQASLQMSGTLESIRQASDSITRSTDGFNRLTREGYSLLTTQNEKIESIMRHLEITSRNLMELSSDAKSYPSYILFGDKPLEIE
jgi:hypothetical protein